MERWLSRQDPGLSAAVDRELARVTVMLEAADGWALERVAGHNRCAIMYGQRHLWELADEQYAVAERGAEGVRVHPPPGRACSSTEPRPSSTGPAC